MIGKRVFLTIGYCFLLELISLRLTAQDGYTAESLKKWTQTVEREQAAIEIIRTCEPDKGIVPICGIQNPEDLAVTPSERWVLFREENGIGALRIPDHRISRIYSSGSRSSGRNSWGSKTCTGPHAIDGFAPLGIDLFSLKSGELRLLVVNRGRNPSIEFFEISELPETIRGTWRGCVPMPPGVGANSVATIPAGGFVISTMPLITGPAYVERPRGFRICSGLVRAERPLETSQLQILPNVCLRVIPASAGPMRAELIEVGSDMRIKELWAGSGSCHFTGISDLDPWHKIPVRQTLGCFYAVMDFELNEGRVLETV